MEKETFMQESYHKLTTNERQLLFKVFRESSFYNFVQFLNHVEELYDGDYEKALREDLRKVSKSYDASGKSLRKGTSGAS
jgi:hypothetical protein